MRAVGALGVIEPPPIQISSSVFEGSLAALFVCVRDHKVELRDIPLFPICQAYFEYMIALDHQDLDQSSAAISALAYLLERKAWLLLPTLEPEPEIEDAAELPDPTIQEFAAAIAALAIWREERNQLFFRTPGNLVDPYEIPFALEDISASDLAREFERVLRLATPEPFEPPSKPRLSLQEQMRLVLLVMTSEWRSLADILPIPLSREQAVYWFLALLELLRLGQIRAVWSGDDIVYARPTE